MDGKELKEILANHKKWLNGNKGQKADLSFADLSFADLSFADLSSANLSFADLSFADLRSANLGSADLSFADLRSADLRSANLRSANLGSANLSFADLRCADLRCADLRSADLSFADLSFANLSFADLSFANLEFYHFPSIRLLSSFPLGKLSDTLTLELMRRDAYAHPKPDTFQMWAKGGECPYQDEERFWFFEENRNLWKAGKPQMRDSDLILAICKEKKWQLKTI